MRFVVLKSEGQLDVPGCYTEFATSRWDSVGLYEPNAQHSARAERIVALGRRALLEALRDIRSRARRAC